MSILFTEDDDRKEHKMKSLVIVSSDGVPALLSSAEAVIEPLSKGGTLTIKDEAGASAMVDRLAFVRQIKKSLDSARTNLVGPLNKRVRSINDAFRRISDPVTTAEGRIKDALADWRRRQLAEAEAEQARIKAENEARLQAAQEATEAAKSDARASMVEEAQKSGYTATEAEELGNLAAEEVPDEPPQVPMAIPPPTPETTMRSVLGAAQVRKVWRVKVTDKTALVRHWLAVALVGRTNPEWAAAPVSNLIKVDMVELRALCPKKGRSPLSIPGVEFYQEEVIAGTS